MSKRELVASASADIFIDGGFKRCFQELILLALKKRGMLTEYQYRAGMRCLGEKSR